MSKEEMANSQVEEPTMDEMLGEGSEPETEKAPDWEKNVGKRSTNPTGDNERVPEEVKRANQAEGTRKSWENEEIRAKRTVRRACTVSVNGGEPVYFSSVATAFQHFKLPIGDHYKMRANLRADEGCSITYSYVPPVGVEGIEGGDFVFTDCEVKRVEKPKKEKKPKAEGDATPKAKKPRKKKAEATPVEEKPTETVDVEAVFD